MAAVEEISMDQFTFEAKSVPNTNQIVTGDLTVVIKCFSHERFFKRALLSALKQRSAKTQIIVYDNGAPNSYALLIKQLCREHNIRLLRTTRNKHRSGIF